MNGIPNKSVTLLLGGVRSGKSHSAQNLAAASGRVAFVATAEAGLQRGRQRHSAGERFGPIVPRSSRESEPAVAAMADKVLLPMAGYPMTAKDSAGGH